MRGRSRLRVGVTALVAAWLVGGAALPRPETRTPTASRFVGRSHGAWTALDFLASASPETVQGLRGVVAFYPYCGIASLARWRGLGVDVPVLMMLAEADRIVAADSCLRLADEQGRLGA